MLAHIEKNIYLCTAFERDTAKWSSICTSTMDTVLGSLGEWLKPPVC